MRPFYHDIVCVPTFLRISAIHNYLMRWSVGNFFIYNTNHDKNNFETSKNTRESARSAENLN